MSDGKQRFHILIHGSRILDNRSIAGYYNGDKIVEFSAHIMAEARELMAETMTVYAYKLNRRITLGTLKHILETKEVV